MGFEQILSSPANGESSIAESNDWKWKEFRFESGTLYLSQEAQRLGENERETFIDDVRKFQNQKPEIFHSGSDGSVYITDSGAYIVKEQMSPGRVLFKERKRIEGAIASDPSFPDDIELIEYLAAVDPPYEKDEFGRRRGPENFSGYETQVAVGSGDWTRDAKIGGYVVMPLIGEGVDLGDLYRYSPQSSDEAVQAFVDAMMHKGLIRDESEVQKFAETHGKRIETSLRSALVRNGEEDFLEDFAFRNIIPDISGSTPKFVVIDI